MLKLLSEWWRYLIVSCWIVKAGFRMATGRWHVFRDAPEWVLVRLAKIDTDHADGELIALCDAATDELMLRLNTELRRLDREVRDIREKACTPPN